MNTANPSVGHSDIDHVPALSSRAVLLWVTLGLFLLRVIGQVEVCLLAPDWLPPMDAWYSGWLSYPLLLPAQMLLLMGMTVSAYTRTCEGYRNERPATRVDAALRALAIIYFAAMVVRLALTIRVHGEEFYLHGAIPVAFHWVLALFLMGLARPAGSAQRARPIRPRQLTARRQIRRARAE